MVRTVLILGGSLAGLGVAHRLLKYTLPREKDLHVVLVSKNSHFYWNIASVRAVIPGIVKTEELLQPILPGLSQYPPASIEFIVGAATSLDAATKTAHIQTSISGSRAVSYDYLVLATGAGAADPEMPWKASGTYDECVASLHDTAGRIKVAQHIVVAGAGPTGVEVSAEIRYEFRNKDVVLLCADESLVGGDSIAGSVEAELGKVGVEVRKGVRSTEVTSVGDGRTRVGLSNGESILTDLYLPTTGLVPNTDYLPEEMLTEKKFVDVDEYLCVRNAEDTWALGDIISKPRPSFLHTEAQSASVAKNIDLALKDEKQQLAKGPLVDAFICSIGRRRGAGRLGSIPLPSFSVWVAKGRTLGMERTAKYVNGTMW